MTSGEESVRLLADAYDNIQHARDNNRIGIHRVAVSLAYYAAFYAAQSVVAACCRAAKTHSGLIATFQGIVRKDAEFPPEGRGVIASLFGKRATADYDWAHRQQWTEEDARQAISQAEWFVGEVAGWHRRNRSSQA